MIEFQERVINENVELNIKITALDNFVKSKLFKNLPNDEVARLGEQLVVMKKYSSILSERINLFKGE